MSVAKVIEISAQSDTGFEDAIRRGIARASETVTGIKGAWIKEQKVDVENNRIVGYRVILRVTFELS